MTRRIAVPRELLERLMWRPDAYDAFEICSECSENKPGHATDCALRAALDRPDLPQMGGGCPVCGMEIEGLVKDCVCLPGEQTARRKP